MCLRERAIDVHYKREKKGHTTYILCLSMLVIQHFMNNYEIHSFRMRLLLVSARDFIVIQLSLSYIHVTKVKQFATNIIYDNGMCMDYD